MFKKVFVSLIIFFHLFIVVSSGLDTHLCIHESGHVSFERLSSNGNCATLSEIFNYKFDEKEYLHKYSKDPCIDIFISKDNRSNHNNPKIDGNFLNDSGTKITYNIQIKQDFEYTSSNIFENNQKIPIQNKSDNIRTFIFLN